MAKKYKKANGLIKRTKLQTQIKKAGVRRISPDALDFLEDVLGRYINKLALLLNDEIMVNGRKTLKRKDILEVLNRLDKKNTGWEI